MTPRLALQRIFRSAEDENRRVILETMARDRASGS
jgi:hypothetical protein